MKKHSSDYIIKKCTKILNCSLIGFEQNEILFKFFANIVSVLGTKIIAAANKEQLKTVYFDIAILKDDIDNKIKSLDNYNVLDI